MLSITREEFREIYSGLPILDSIDLFYSIPQSDQDVMFLYLPSKLWRLNNIYTIVDKKGNRIRFCMNRSQHKVYAASLRHPRLIVLKSRQQGISTLWLVSFFDDTVSRSDFSIGLMAQGQDEASTLLERVKVLWGTLDQSIKEYLNIGVNKDNTKEFSLDNGSSVFIRTSFRSTTLQRLHISEMGKIANKYPEKASETKTGTLQAIAQGNTAVIESTAEGDNMFKDMWDNAMLYSDALSPKDFMPIFLSWLDDPDCVVERDQVISSKQAKYFTQLESELGFNLSRVQKNFWVAQFRELGEKIYQEYPSTPLEAFMATKDGAYYAHLFFEYIKTLKREVTGLFDKNLEVQAAIDLGMNDTNSIGIMQTYQESVRVIDEYADSGQDIKFYCDWMKDQYWFPNLTHVVLPHDANVKELTSGKTRAQVFEEELASDKNGNPTGIYFTTLEKTNVNDGIEQVRQLVKVMWIDPACEYIKSCLINYKKEWDDKRDRWRNKPLHDEYSNGADMLRYAAQGLNRGTRMRRPSQYDSARRRARGGFDV